MMVTSGGLRCRGIMGQFSIYPCIIGIQNDKAVPVVVKVIVTALQTIHLKNICKIFLIRIVVSKDIVDW